MTPIRLTRGNLSPAMRIMVPACLGFAVLLAVRCLVGSESTTSVDDVLPLGAYAAGYGTAALLMLLGMVTQDPDRYQLGAMLLAVTASVWALALMVAIRSWGEVWGFYWAWPAFVAATAVAVHRSLETARKP